MFRSATLKLTLSYLAIITLLCIMFSGTIYHFATSELHQGLDRQSQRLSNDFPGFNFDPALRPETDYRTSSHHILLNLIYFNILVVAAAGFASYGLARWTLKPIEASHDQQKRFTTDVSHELRTPLTSLKMTTEIALMDKAAKKKNLREVLASNLEDANKLEGLVNNILRLTRLEASELQGQFSPVDVNEVAAAALQDCRDLATAKNIAVVTDFSDAKPLVSGDTVSIAQLITILLDNAIKYSPEGSTVTLATSGGRNNVRLKVTDHGVGIAPADLPHIFERFYRTDKARTSGDSSGYGLGLSIARMITELHNGQMRVTSQVGYGTTISLDLPKIQA
jgi:signal transduction histidine kinase